MQNYSIILIVKNKNMKNVLNFPNYNTFFLSTKKKVFNGMSRIIAYSKSYFMLKICILVEWLIIEIII